MPISVQINLTSLDLILFLMKVRQVSKKGVLGSFCVLFSFYSSSSHCIISTRVGRLEHLIGRIVGRGDDGVVGVVQDQQVGAARLLGVRCGCPAHPGHARRVARAVARDGGGAPRPCPRADRRRRGGGRQQATKAPL